MDFKIHIFSLIDDIDMKHKDKNIFEENWEK